MKTWAVQLFNPFKKHSAPPLREVAVGIVCTEIAINAGLDSDRAAQVARFAQTILASGAVASSYEAIQRGEQFALRLADLDATIERHGNLGWVPVHHFQRVNHRDLPQPPVAEEST